MSEKQVFNINQKLFNQLNDWQEKMEKKENAKAEIEANNEANHKKQKINDVQKEKD
ncbi:MAG: hypothetical protein F6K24_33240 [Okeania sp. SIO2D1]|uniref:hypothetical protein n=1 Tax=Okeania sp. SIO2C9 TaxID=2607791 RepID=UPI0013BCF418|nr:hypothetical protein [Okeania sp. SIO2C9]NEQ75298.1 hypothetical protein [Okeania sp. SIO2C9]NES69737.1 hypothetical protein [Okeania sp. SIO2D1]